MQLSHYFTVSKRWLNAHATTLRLAASYLLIIMVMSLGFSVVLYHISAHELGRQVPPDHLFTLRPQHILLLGGGAFTLPKAILENFPAVRLDIVEPDAGLLDIAQKYFGFKPTRHTRVHHNDGRHFLETTNGAYDLIIVDAFIDTDIPPSLQTVEAAASLRTHTAPAGSVAMNVIAAYHGFRSSILRRQIAALKTSFSHLQLFPANSGDMLWLPENYILTAQTGHHDLRPYLRYEPLKLPRSWAAEAPHDA